MTNIMDELINAIHNKRHKLIHESPKEPRLAVYMSYDFWVQCQSSLHGNVSPTEYEFMTSNTLFGYKVWRVIQRTDSAKGVNEQHPPWVIVNLDF